MMKPDYRDPVSIAGLVARLFAQASREKPDWGEVESVRMHLDLEANTKPQKEAVAGLRHALQRGNLAMIAQQIQKAFLDGTPGADGWPRKF
jgi:hypothetical protein